MHRPSASVPAVGRALMTGPNDTLLWPIIPAPRYRLSGYGFGARLRWSFIQSTQSYQVSMTQTAQLSA